MIALRMRLPGHGMDDLGEIVLRAAQAADHDRLWSLLEPVFGAGETYAIDPEITREDALDWWQGGTHDAFIAEAGGDVLGSYYICANQQGGGAHVCNCGFVTAIAAQGRGVARAMLAHALAEAHRRGFYAMQFNHVVSTNARAIRLWQQHGFKIVGRLPGAFRHPKDGLVDAYVMYRLL